MINKTQANRRFCNICENYFMYEEGVFDHALNIHSDWTICNIQINDLKSVNLHFIVKHKLKLYKCEICENYFKTEDNLDSDDSQQVLWQNILE